MADTGPYRDRLLEHFHNPRNKGELVDADITRRGSNPRCGDEVEVGVYLQGDRLAQVKFRGRGCSICIASSSMMTEAVRGRSRNEAQSLCEQMQAWFASSEAQGSIGPPGELQALSAIRAYPARHRCILLSWEALRDALDAL